MNCPRCDRLTANYSAAAERGDRAGSVIALEAYDTHRLASHGKGRPRAS